MKYACNHCGNEFKTTEPLSKVMCKCGAKFTHENGVIEIIPTKKEISEFKKNLYSSLIILSMERYEFHPRKRDSLRTLMDSFFYWASEYNDNYFSEMDEKDDRYCAWLVQEFRKY